ncbi:helix-turn-helix transcriptional regulator [Hymenobacter norwichensis]|uniref:helix-turn-helix transcriptional regulator n=1 Tax=Hymenobacter norwichensis TaxID=223903 RepID=UPI0003B5C71D|nr:LuxR C-terminal-related transcriptional regulator [Hymenobacter norwichensis]
MNPTDCLKNAAVLVAAPPSLHRQGLLSTLHEQWPDLSFSVTADTCMLEPLLRQQPYALLVLDSALAGPSLGTLFQRLRNVRSCQPILVIASQRLSPVLRQHLLQPDTNALLPYNSTPAMVVATVMPLLSGATGGMLGTVATRRNFTPPTPFSQREVEVLRLITADLCNQEIADHLCLSVRTVESHRRALLQKAGAKTLVGLVMQAMREGWVGVA